ncbi:hypothetical protein [Marinobacter caseinilyticus]|nr:hypothetical protein [Marinobacter caseinilyticus]
MDILVNIGGVLLMAAIVGWFWFSGKRTAKPSSPTQADHHH